jgi:alanyl-tRNA synthetase
MYQQTRDSFKNFFKTRGHEVVESSPVIPSNDPTLLFANSGMVQFKNVFTGLENLKCKDPLKQGKTATTVQKCIRAGGKHNDLENVGFTNRHHTFFEMLGNFSFGDYFKEGAIKYAFDFLTKELSLPLEKLYFTVYHNDDEAFGLWKKIAGVADDKIIRIDTNANFWQMGDTGPCGPCSEIFYDYGDKIFGGLPGTKDEDGPRYTEIWNLVFMQYERLADSSLTPLRQQCIDTGMGLERLVSVLEGKTDNYETSLFAGIINESKKFLPTSKLKLSGAKEDYVHRIIADHIRAAVFMIADGIMPSNEGRGYVLRRIIRRALRHYFMNGGRESFMHKLSLFVILQMNTEYPELERAKSFIVSTLKNEEEMFLNLLPDGLKILEKETDGKTVLGGDIAFKLYDTFGFPLDITEDILKQKNIKLDIDGFEKAMQEQRQRSKASWVGSGDSAGEDEIAKFALGIKQTNGDTIFDGYRESKYKDLNIKAKALGILKLKDENVLIATDKTVFYPEGGGQMCDKGTIDFEDSIFAVTDVKKNNGIILHTCTLQSEFDANLVLNKTLSLKVDSKLRALHEANHTATHLLHYALRANLGEGVVQKGSLVASERLRFDFAFNRALTLEEIVKTESLVNSLIKQNLSVTKEIKPKEEALKSGVMALFGEKYEDNVRVVTTGESKELCGGCHVLNTGEIGMFKIIYEKGIGGGIRRIEAKTGLSALEYINAELLKYNQVMEFNKVQNKEDSNELLNFVSELKKQNKSLEVKLNDFKQSLLLQKPIKNTDGFDVLNLNQGEIEQNDIVKLLSSNFNAISKPLIVKIVSKDLKPCFVACKSLKTLPDAKEYLLSFAKSCNLDCNLVKGSNLFAFLSF